MAPSKVISLKSKGKSSSNNKGGFKSETERTTVMCLEEWSTWALKKAKVITHYGFVPMVIIIGMNSDPKPHFSQIFTPI